MKKLIKILICAVLSCGLVLAATACDFGDTNGGSIVPPPSGEQNGGTENGGTENDGNSNQGGNNGGTTIDPEDDDDKNYTGNY